MHSLADAAVFIEQPGDGTGRLLPPKKSKRGVDRPFSRTFVSLASSQPGRTLNCEDERSIHNVCDRDCARHSDFRCRNRRCGTQSSAAEGQRMITGGRHQYDLSDTP